MGEYKLSTGKLDIMLETAPLKLMRIVNQAKPEVCDDIADELFWMKYEGKRFLASEFTVLSVEEHADGRYQLLRVSLEHEIGVAATLSFLADKDNSVELILQMWSKSGKPAVFVELGLPFLSDGKNLGLADAQFRAPSAPFVSSRGEPILDLHPACLKVMSFVRRDGIGLDLSFDIPKESNTQSGTLMLPMIADRDQLKTFTASVRLNRYPAVVFRMKFDAVSDGWLETFRRIKQISRSKVDLDSYSRPDLKWYESTCLHHFTYVYSEEIYDYERGVVDIDRLLTDGEEFGGYDVICLWHQYPRLGVDERCQWDFFEDFPGGLDGIKAISDKCHARGVKVMLPYKPWDAPERMSPEDTAKMLAAIIAATDVDGYFLDTMSNIPDNFRIEADQVKPGCVFCTELFPENSKVLSMLTGSWQQSEVLPYQIPILRYVFPEHHSHFIDRWAIDQKRDQMLQKAILNGSGVVVWQDIFGAWLPYEEYQKKEVKAWKQIWQSHRDYFFTDHVVPLWPGEQQDLVICAYLHPDGKSAVFTVYNHADHAVDGALFAHRLGEVTEAVSLWGDVPVSVGNGMVSGIIQPGQTAVIRVE